MGGKAKISNRNKEMKVDNRMLKEKQLAGGKGGDHEERDDRTRYWET